MLPALCLLCVIPVCSVIVLRSRDVSLKVTPGAAVENQDMGTSNHGLLSVESGP